MNTMRILLVVAPMLLVGCASAMPALRFTVDVVCGACAVAGQCGPRATAAAVRRPVAFESTPDGRHVPVYR